MAHTVHPTVIGLYRGRVPEGYMLLAVPKDEWRSVAKEERMSVGIDHHRELLAEVLCWAARNRASIEATGGTAAECVERFLKERSEEGRHDRTGL